jgi:hypothetical protein
MSDNETQIDKADQPRLVAYPHPATGELTAGHPLVQFPSLNEMDEEAFRAAAESAYPQLLREHVGQHYGPHEDYGYVDALIKDFLAGKLDQARLRAQAWHDARTGDQR